jgi:hypothetical protein
MAHKGGALNVESSKIPVNTNLVPKASVLSVVFTYAILAVRSKKKHIVLELILTGLVVVVVVATKAEPVAFAGLDILF